LSIFCFVLLSLIVGDLRGNQPRGKIVVRSGDDGKLMVSGDVTKGLVTELVGGISNCLR
jgi:hypothetical protein